MRTDESTFEDRLRRLAAEEDPALLREALEDERPEDVAEALVRLDPDDRLAVLQAMDPDGAAAVLVELPDAMVREIVAQLPDATVAHYLDVLPMDDAVELRESLDPVRFEALLRVIPDEDAQEMRRLLAYPEGTAGRMLTEDFLSIPPAATMDEVLSLIRVAAADRFETVNTIYVVGEDRHLLGVLSLRRVLRSDPAATARETMNDDPVSVPAEMEEEEVARTLARYGFTAVPVLDARGRMLGIVTADDAQEVLEEAQTEDVLALGGVIGDAEAYFSLSVPQLLQRRLPWLLILFLAEFFTGSVLRYYTNESETAGKTNLTQLTLFIPLLIGAGGNAGSQVTTTITRALALGEVRASDWWRVLRREFAVAALIGAALALLGFLRAHTPYVGWGLPLPISLVVAFALPAIVVWAAAVGSLLPIGAKALKQDPAVMSAPFISTFVDATGLIIYFEIAKAVLRAYGQTF